LSEENLKCLPVRCGYLEFSSWSNVRHSVPLFWLGPGAILAAARVTSFALNPALKNQLAAYRAELKCARAG
jgi:uncharacterized protein (DUF1501 family)